MTDKPRYVKQGATDSSVSRRVSFVELRERAFSILSDEGVASREVRQVEAGIRAVLESVLLDHEVAIRLLFDHYYGRKLMSGIERIAAERQRQVEAEGYSHSHDDGHDDRSIVFAAVAYALLATRQASHIAETYWPWDDGWKPSPDPVRNLEKAGALIAAELDRLQRAREAE